MKFAELSEPAKSVVRQRHHEGMDYEWWDTVYADAERIGSLLGIDVEKIYFSGFSSQGDGASFEGSYYYRKGSLAAVKAEAPLDKELHKLAAALQKVQARQFYKLEASAVVSGHYVHSGCMRVSVSHADSNYRDIGTAEEDIRQLLREFADWIYSQLEREYNYLTSDEAIEEMDEEYTEEGDIA